MQFDPDTIRFTAAQLADLRIARDLTAAERTAHLNGAAKCGTVAAGHSCRAFATLPQNHGRTVGQVSEAHAEILRASVDGLDVLIAAIEYHGVACRRCLGEGAEEFGHGDECRERQCRLCDGTGREAAS
jgi:hypothetical protein